MYAIPTHKKKVKAIYNHAEITYVHICSSHISHTVSLYKDASSQRQTDINSMVFKKPEIQERQHILLRDFLLKQSKTITHRVTQALKREVYGEDDDNEEEEKLDLDLDLDSEALGLDQIDEESSQEREDKEMLDYVFKKNVKYSIYVFPDVPYP